jgi:hypothetical protein
MNPNVRDPLWRAATAGGPESNWTGVATRPAAAKKPSFSPTAATYEDSQSPKYPTLIGVGGGVGVGAAVALGAPVLAMGALDAAELADGLVELPAHAPRLSVATHKMATWRIARMESLLLQ